MIVSIQWSRDYIYLSFRYNTVWEHLDKHQKVGEGNLQGKYLNYPQKSLSRRKIPSEWKNIEVMEWGGHVLYEPGKGRALKNTCPIDNFLWICYCWYIINPDTFSSRNHVL